MNMNYKFNRAVGNIISSFIKQISSVLLGFIIPKLVVVNLGSEVNGLLSTINQALTYATLLEAGVGLASLQSLYEPVAKNDKDSINGVISATNRFYKKTAFYYLIVIVLLAVIFPFFIQTKEISKMTMTIIIFICGLPGIVSFYFQAAYKILLSAEGKSYVITNIATVCYILTNIFKILLLLNGCGIILLQMVFCCIEMLSTFYIVRYMKKNYSWVDFNYEPNWESISKKNSVLTHQISGMVFNHTDVLILSIFCGLSTTSVYSIYAMLYAVVATIIENFDGVKFVLGQSFHNNKELFGKQYECYEFFNMTLTFALFTIANIFIIPFMKIYTVGMSDIQYINPILSYLFWIQYILSSGRNSSASVIVFASHFKETQLHAIIEMAINIIVSIICALSFGIYGVTIGTISALLFRTTIMIIYANKNILHRNPYITIKRWIINVFISIVVLLVSNKIIINLTITNYYVLIGWSMIFGVIILIVYFLVMLIFENNIICYFKELIHK